jgi:acyl-CoA synthetase (AMP-forming)/AMP-acid ligase II
MSKRDRILAEPVPPWPKRRRAIEATPVPASVPMLLAEAAAAAPDTVALDVFEQGERRTYGELLRDVEALAAGLALRGIGHGTHVGVMLPNVIAFPLTWLALARLGAVMVPINGAYTPRELDYVLTDADVTHLVIDAEFEAVFDALETRPATLTGDHVIVHGGSRDTWHACLAAGRNLTLPPPTVGQNDLLNIQYTSGTTGFPKGCMLTQLYWLTIGKVNAFRDGRAYTRILAATPFFYMDPQWQLMMAFYARATLYVARRQSASRFMGWVRDHRIDFTLLPEVVVKQPATPEDADNAIVRVNCYGLSRGNHAAIEHRFDLVCREAFGMTEIGSTLFVPMEATETVGSGTCGVPVAYRETRIVDEAGHDVPTGEIGEMIVRGPGILTGYYKKPEATAAALRDGWFHTGDMFRRDAAGWHYIVGRKKDMIRRAGENIAAREVEAVVLTLPDVEEAAAIPVPDADRGEEVKILVKLKPGRSREDCPPSDILAHCAGGLAKFKVPRYVGYVAEFPHTASGKIAKHLLGGDPRLDCYDRVDDIWR